MAEIDEKTVNTEQKPQSEVGSSPSEPNKAVNKAETEEITRLKAALSRANSEASEYKKALREKQTEQERKEAELAEQRKAELEELNALRTEKRISGYKAKLMEAGIDGATADLMANALPEGVKDEYFASVKNFNENQRKALDVNALNKQPGLSVGMPPSGAAKTDLDKQLDKIFGL